MWSFTNCFALLTISDAVPSQDEKESKPLDDTKAPDVKKLQERIDELEDTVRRIDIKTLEIKKLQEKIDELEDTEKTIDVEKLQKVLDVQKLREKVDELEDTIQRTNMENRYNHHVYPSQYLSDEFTVFRFLSIISHYSPTEYKDLLVSNYGRICWQHLNSYDGSSNAIRFNMGVPNYSQLAFLNKKLNLEQLKKLRDYEATVEKLQISKLEPNINGLVKFLSEL